MLKFVQLCLALQHVHSKVGRVLQIHQQAGGGTQAGSKLHSLKWGAGQTGCSGSLSRGIHAGSSIRGLVHVLASMPAVYVQLVRCFDCMLLSESADAQATD